MSSQVDQIKERLGIVDVISQYIKLEKAGSNLKAKCPFHNEKTPSFTVSPLRNTYYCFGCNEKGDIFSFIEKFEGLDFLGALRVLGQKAGISIVYERREVKDERLKSYSILEKATEFFEENLKSSERKDIIDYLCERGLNDKTMQLWQIGYAPADWNKLYDHLNSIGFSAEDIEKVGLIKKSEKSEGSYYDRFRDRIIFPIFDSSGRIIAFSGRINPLSGDDDKTSRLRSEQAAKYINSPETSLFNKSKILYGYDKAKLAIRKFDFSIVVEGQMDLLMSHQSGFPNTVAISGTALTNEHIKLLQRLSNNIILAFDSDSAGIKSSGRGTDLALAGGMDVKVTALSEGKDPADLMKEDVAKWKEAIKNSKHIVDFYLDILSSSESDERKLKLKVREIIIPYIAKIPNKIDQAHFISKTAMRIGVSESSVLDELQKIHFQRIQQNTPDASHYETDIVSRLPRKDAILRKIEGILLLNDNLKKKDIDTAFILDNIKQIAGEEAINDMTNRAEDEKNKLLFETESLYKEDDDLNGYIEELLLNFEEECLKEKCSDALSELRRAESANDKEKMSKALKQYKELSDNLAKLR